MNGNRYKGYYEFPCFVDTHAHIISLGLKLSMVDLESEDLMEILRKPRKILIGRGWTEMPPLKLLNSVDYPVILIRKCGHSAVLNDVARRALGFTRNVIYEEEVEKVYDLYDLEDFKGAFKRAEREFFRVGVSHVHSDDLHGLSYEELVEILKDSKIRVYEKLAVKEPKEWMFRRISKRVEIKAIKLFADGSIGSRTAYMKEPYVDTGERGVFLLDHDELESMLNFADRNGVEVCIHAIGDAAIGELADHLARHPGHRIIHAQFVPEETLGKLRKTRFSVQPHFYYEDLEILKYVRTNSMVYPFLKLHELGFEISFSSDAPVSPHDPRYVIEAALKMGFSKEEAFKLYTKGSKDKCLYETDDPMKDYPVAIVMEDGEIIDLSSV